MGIARQFSAEPIAKHARDMSSLRSEMMRMMAIGVTCAGFLIAGGAVGYVKLPERIDFMAEQTAARFDQTSTRYEPTPADPRR